jgi:hypothetical protein
MGHLGEVIADIYYFHVLFPPSHPCPIPSCLGLNSSRLCSPNILHPPCSKLETTLMMPHRLFSQHIHPDEDLHRTSTQYQPFTHILSTIAEGSEHPVFDDILEV